MKKLLNYIFFSISFISYAQDCNQINVEVTSGGQDSEIGWNIAQYNGWAILSGSVGVTNGCIQDGCWTFNMYDGGGDGWAGSIITISTDNQILYSGTLENGNYQVNTLQIGNSVPCEEPAYGCTDESATNYNALATDNDGSCEWIDCIGDLSSTSLNIYIEDSVCHSNLYCENFNWDGGDCVFDCNDNLMTLSDVDIYFYNDQCDDFFNCMFYYFDNESCIEPQGCEDENGVIYENGVQWNTDPCTICSCENGQISCMVDACEFPMCEAPNYLEDVQGECCPVCVEVEPNSDCSGISITLYDGWNMIGFACSENTNASLAFSNIEDKIVIAKDASGNAYLPDFDFNGIGDLERGYGYLMKVTEQITNYNVCE